MSRVAPAFPHLLDVFVPLIDGYSPISASDINLQLSAIERIQQLLGYGEVRSGVGVYGPKGASGSVAARLDTFLDPDGALRDVAFVTGSMPAGEFSTKAQTLGAYIPFGKPLTGATMGPGGYVVLFSATYQDLHALESSGSWGGEGVTLGYWWVSAKSQYGCWIKARDWRGGDIEIDASTNVQYALLAFGPAAVPAL